MRKFHLSKKWGGQGPPGPPVAATAVLNNLFFFNIQFLDKIICHLIMLLIIIRPKYEISAFPTKAGEKPMVVQFFQSNSEKAHFSAFPAFPAFPAGVDTLFISFPS